MWACPNCGPAKVVKPGEVYFEFGHGCKRCNLPGHDPLPGYMEPLPASHPRVVFGLAPAIEEAEGDAPSP